MFGAPTTEIEPLHEIDVAEPNRSPTEIVGASTNRRRAMHATAVGAGVGRVVGAGVGRVVGTDVGARVGRVVGALVGARVGRVVGGGVGGAGVGAGVGGAGVGGATTTCALKK